MNRVLKVIIRIVLAIVALVLVWAVISCVLTLSEKSAVVQTGEYVLVHAEKMNVYSAGEGEHTIVLMPGLGTAVPVLDFMPLSEKLSANYKVVVVEPFGYGWSEQTDKPRTVENMVEELREALTQSGNSGPYILMAHSISGLYATWYADTYPDEVEAVIGIDCMLPRQVQYFDGGSAGSVPNIAKLVAPLGLSRLLVMISPSMFISDNSTDAYTQENLDTQKKLASWQAYNRDVIDELNMADRNIAVTLDMGFDADLPLLFFSRSDKNRTAREDGKTSIGFYESYITDPTLQKVVESDGHHYLHWTLSDEMAEQVSEFVTDCLD